MDGMCEWDDEAESMTQCINLMTSRPPPVRSFLFSSLRRLKACILSGWQRLYLRVN